jgi:membrane carboxypeptidase/penicillin-binding protein
MLKKITIALLLLVILLCVGLFLYGWHLAVDIEQRFTARRQPGSAFKPFVYLSGLDKFSPSDMLPNQPQTYTVDGKTLEHKHLQIERLIPPQKAFIMNFMLQSVVTAEYTEIL